MTVQVHEIRRDERPLYRERIRGLEQGVRYPLGIDEFEIDHGEDPFAFFDRLGSTVYLAAIRDGEVVGGMASVLRQLPGPPKRSAWYLCDLKSVPGWRGRGISAPLFSHALSRLAGQSERAYGISMDPGDGAPNRVVRRLSRVPGGHMRFATTLEIFNFDDEAMERVRPTVERHRGAVGWLSLEGIKDLKLKSTGSRMPLLHTQFGPCAAPGSETPVPGAVHMLCTPIGDALGDALRRSGHAPDATASIVQRSLPDQDWRMVLTSDI